MNNRHQLFELIQTVADKVAGLCIRLPRNRAYVPGGMNGPYFDVETPVRNTAHWLVVYSILSRHSDDWRYRELAEQFLNFLIQPDVYRERGIYIHRQKKGKDWSNGVIGQAWIIEALSIAAETPGMDEARVHAKKYAILSFDKKVSAWNRPKLASFNEQIDYTLNHQLWYAAAVAEANSDQKLDEVEAFLTTLDRGGFRIRKNGRISHLLHSNASAKGLLLQARYKLLYKRNYKSVSEKETGYHLYNLFPLARLKAIYPDHSFFSNARLKRALMYCVSYDFLNSLKSNRYSYPYNSPAFEFPLILDHFHDEFNRIFSSVSGEKIKEELEKQLNYQLEVTFDEGTGLFSRSNPDPITLTSRIYELAIGWERTMKAGKRNEKNLTALL